MKPQRILKCAYCACLIFVALPIGAIAQTVTLTNIVPSSLSAETNQDSEPDLTVNPNNPNEIIGTAFTPNPTGATATAPIYISQDGGTTWVLNNIVPSGNGMTGDITVGLSRNNVLYAGILRGGSGLDMRLLRSNTYLTAAAMTQLMNRSNEDQPYTRVHSPLGGPFTNKDLLYVGHNDFTNAPKTASFEQSLDAATAAPPAGLGPVRLERRTPSSQDGPPIRQAIHADGTVYAVYDQITTIAAGNNITSNIVVVRDDDWGQGATAYDSLTDPSDGLAGRIVAPSISWVFNSGSVFGQERLADRVSIAVDPRDSDIVYVAWADRVSAASGNTLDIHVRRSIDRGVTWSVNLFDVTGATVPQLAVNVRGDVGIAYQQLVSVGGNQRWQTHFQQSTNGGMNWADTILADTSATQPPRVFGPYLGDYLGCTAVGKDFVGIFSASNLPDNTNFPNGVSFQRVADFATNTLGDGAGGSTSVSIDPYFFKIQNQLPGNDFFVRDWTNSPTQRDTGLEPSTYPWFFVNSDVWNRRSSAGGGFNANDQPQSEDPWPSTLGSNFAFARVHRRDVGAATSVNLHFLKSEFGTGSNYVNAGASSDPTLNFNASDTVQTMTAGYQWDLSATTSSHVCLAVEISTPDDPVAAPSLLGRAPGWPDTDLAVIYDNNKAQRNLGVYLGAGKGSITYWAIVHNAALFKRHFQLRFDMDPIFKRIFEKAEIRVVGPGKYRQGDGEVTLFDMPPGENRWVGLTIPIDDRQLDGQAVAVSFTEVVRGLPINGFTIQQTKAPMELATLESLRMRGGNLSRIGSIYRDEKLIEDAKSLAEITRANKLDPEKYVAIQRAGVDVFAAAVNRILKDRTDDPFGIRDRLAETEAAIRKGDPAVLLPLDLDLDHAVDSFLTYFQKEVGDIADAGQMVLWQEQLMADVQLLGELPIVESKNEPNQSILNGAKDDSANAYLAQLASSMAVFRAANTIVGINQDQLLSELEASQEDPQKSQKLHREFLTALSEGTTKYRELNPMSTLIFQGTVEAQNNSTLSQLAANDDTFRVRIDKVLVQQGAVRLKSGSSITVIDNTRSIKTGQQYIIHAEPFMFGETIAVTLNQTTENADFNPELALAAKQGLELERRAKMAQVIISGQVTEVRPIDSPSPLLSEHQPLLMQAVVKTDKVLKGEVRGDTVTFIFAQSDDVHWFRAPKFNAEDKGVFLLSAEPPEKLTMGLSDNRLTLFNAADFIPVEAEKPIQKLMNIIRAQQK